MTQPISTVVSVTVTRATRTVTQAGFGTALIFGDAGIFAAGIVRTYNNLTEVAVDFATTDDEYKAANALFAQTPAPLTVKITQRETPVAQVQTLTFSADLLILNVINMDVDGAAIGPIAWAVSHDNTMALIATAIQAEDGVVTAVVTGGAGSRVITVTAAVAGVPVVIDDILVTLGASQATGVMATTVDNVGMPEDIAAVRLVDDDWYVCILDSRVDVVVMSTALTIEAMPKLFITCSSDTDIYDAAVTTDIAYLTSNLNYDRTIVIFNETPASFPDAAWAGRCLPEDPGSITWKFKTLSGVANSALTATQRLAILNKNANLVSEVGGVDITEDGTVASGEFIDIMRGIDWLTARMQENVYQELVTANKIPYTDKGIAIIENLVRKTLNNGISVGLLFEDTATFDGEPFLVSVPLEADVSASDKGSRTLNDVTWQASLAGAIHTVVITGRVTL